MSLTPILGCDLSGEDPPSSFGERTFVSESVDGHELVAGTTVHIRFFEDARISASAGCNSMSSDAYELADGVLHTGGLAVTEKGCAGELHDQDDWLAAFLEASPAFVLDEPRLTLTSDGVTLVMIDEEVADPDRSLEGMVWTVNALIDGVGVMAWSTTPQVPTLEFSDTGALSILTPCASGSGSYAVDGSSMTLTGVSIADEACSDDEVSMTVHEHMAQVLADGTLEYEIDAARLTLERGEIGLILGAP